MTVGSAKSNHGALHGNLYKEKLQEKHGSSAYRGVWIIRQDHAISSLLHIFSLGKMKCRFLCINSNGCITWYSTKSAKYHPSDQFCI